jgi:hypothetical protein
MTQTNMAHLIYDKIEEYAGIERPRIKKGITQRIILPVELMP